MVKLTPELIEQSVQHINPVKDRELVLRGYKIPVIENMGATFDQYDSIDLSDNDIRKVDGFPLLKRLKSLSLNNNKIVRIGEGLSENLPNMESIYMANNMVQELGDLDSLIPLKKLEYISLLGNPVTTRQHYRSYLIHKIPQLRVIDFRRVRLAEREGSKKLFKSRVGKELNKEIKKAKTFSLGEQIIDSRQQGKMSSADQAAIRQAIVNAKSMEEVEMLQHTLRSGNIPARNAARKRGIEEAEM